VYLNVSPTFKDDRDVGALRVRVVREDFNGQASDESGYQDFLMIGKWLITHVWFESGEAGRPLHWEMNNRLGLESAEISTRYAKFFAIPWIIEVPGTSMVKEAVAKVRAWATKSHQEETELGAESPPSD